MQKVEFMLGFVLFTLVQISTYIPTNISLHVPFQIAHQFHALNTQTYPSFKNLAMALKMRNECSFFIFYSSVHGKNRTIGHITSFSMSLLLPWLLVTTVFIGLHINYYKNTFCFRWAQAFVLCGHETFFRRHFGFSSSQASRC